MSRQRSMIVPGRFEQDDEAGRGVFSVATRAGQDYAVGALEGDS